MTMPIEFLEGLVVGVLGMWALFTLAAVVRFLVDMVHGETPWPADSELIDGDPEVDENDD